MKPRGFTLVEVLIAVVLVGALMAVALPFLRTSTVKSSVRGAVAAISSMHATARATSIARGRTTRLVFLPGSVQVLVRLTDANGNVDTVGAVENLRDRFGVSFTASNDSIVFTPRGIGAGLSATAIIVTKGDYADTLVVSAAGRLVQ
jgi:prepilin-type N-terminal cleavage/methylation domain-containing protein